MIWILQSLLATAVIAWVFYDSPVAMAIFPIILKINHKRMSNAKTQKTKREFDNEFKEMLTAVSDALSSGYSIENAFKDALGNIEMLFGDRSVVRAGLREINVKISMRVPAEEAYAEFAEAFPTEETLGFAAVFTFARKLGGDYVKNIRRTIEKMEDKLELKQEIATAIASKQMEFKVMCGMPVGILFYVRLSSGDFLGSLYFNPAGILVMSVCLFIYAVAIYLGMKIVDIRV